MSFTIRGLGKAVPDSSLNADEGRRVAYVLGGATLEGASWLNVVYANCAVKTRHQVIGQDALDDFLTGTRTSGSPFLPNPEIPRGPSTGQRMKMYAESAPKLALQSATEALKTSGFSAASISHLVTVSCTGFIAPGIDQTLIRELGLSANVERVHVGFMGCHGALNGLKVANAFTSAHPPARVLLCAVELCSLHYYMGEEPGKIVANALFADGSASLVGDGLPGAWTVTKTGSVVIPNSAKDMGWNIDDFGFEMTLSKRIPDLIRQNLRGFLDPWLAERGHTIASVGSWAVHPGGPKIVKGAKEALELSDEAIAPSLGVLADYGNMSSPTVLFILDRLRQAEAKRPCVMIGFGPGLVAEAALVE